MVLDRGPRSHHAWQMPPPCVASHSRSTRRVSYRTPRRFLSGRNMELFHDESEPPSMVPTPPHDVAEWMRNVWPQSMARRSCGGDEEETSSERGQALRNGRRTARRSASRRWAPRRQIFTFTHIAELRIIRCSTGPPPHPRSAIVHIHMRCCCSHLRRADCLGRCRGLLID